MIYLGDNLEIMRGMPDASIDLIATDPPYNTKKYQHRACSYNDKWESEEYIEWLEERCIEMKRILKPKGALYLQCDDNEVDYIKVMLDKVFGRKLFKNRIVWKRAPGNNDLNHKHFARVTDYILVYTDGDIDRRACAVDHTQEYLDRTYNQVDERGKYCWIELTSVRSYNPDSKDESCTPWRNIDPFSKYKYWCVPKSGRSEWGNWLGQNIPGYAEEKSIHGRLDLLSNAGMLKISKNGTAFGKKYLAAFSKKKAVMNLWTDINLTPKERNDYPTQKPIALYQRMILASSNPGDTVLDPFMGSGTTLVAALSLGRKAIGIDKSEEAYYVAQKRIRNVPVSIKGMLAA